jgi:hypothetical protein
MKTGKSVFLNGILRFGLISAAVFAVYATLIYVLEVNIFATFFSMFSFLLMILFMVIPMVMGIRYINKQLTHPMAYGSKFLTSMLIGFIGMVVYAFVFWILMFKVDPAYMAGLQERFITDLYDKLAAYNLTEEQIQTSMARATKQMEAMKDPVKYLLTQLASSIILPALTSLIVAASVNTRRYHEDHVVVLDETVTEEKQD